LSLAGKALDLRRRVEFVGTGDLDRDEPFELGIERTINGAETAATDPVNQLEAADLPRS